MNFFETNSHFRVPSKYKTNDGFNLGCWVGTQRKERENLSEKNKAKLEGLGFIWDELDAAWNEAYSKLAEFVEKEGHARVPQRYKSPDGYPLGTWVNTRRHTKNQISAERISMLDELGFVWDGVEAAWEVGHKELTEFVKCFGHAKVPDTYKTDNDFALGVWVGRQRKKRRNLSEDKFMLLDKLGFVWDVDRTRWDKGYFALTEYVKQNGHSRVPARFLTEDGFAIGVWVSKKR